MKTTCATLALAALALLAPVRAAPADNGAQQEALQLADLTGSDAVTNRVMLAMRSQMIQIITAAGAKSEDQAKDIVDNLLMPEFRADLPELRQQMATIWAEALSAADLHAITQFYSTQAGKHFLAAMPEITEKSIQTGINWGQSAARAAVQKHADELRKRGIRI
jgi:hypothetical protein